MRHWGVEDEPRLIKNRENAVFETRTAEGARAALRLHRPGYQSDDSIRSELWWSEALVAAGMDVPVPVRTLADDVLAEVPEAGRMASLVTWVDGAPMGEGDVPLEGTPDAQAALHFALGAELARLHLASDAADLPEGFTRPVLDRDALVGDDPAWGRFWENASLTRPEIEILQAARARLAEILEGQAGADFGLIHADALRENVMVKDGAVQLIDFDDGVFGFRMYELGVAMSQNWDQPNKDALGKALLTGYASLRELPDGAEALLEAFTVMRGLASCGWVIGRYADDHPATRTYAVRAVELCRGWLG
nr:phosphotransferase [Shimia sp. CNT1-13L.2]